MLTTRVPRRLAAAAILACGLLAPATLAAQGSGQTETPYVATKLIWRWRAIMNTTLEESRAFAPEPVTDLMEVFVSPGAVRAVEDKLSEDELKKADAVVERFTFAVVGAARRQDDGSRIVDEEAVEKAEDATCPVYPFCSK
jgi:hypothetical protein